MPLRRVVESPEFEAERARLVPNARAFEAIFRAISWALARHPERGQPLEPPVWAWPTYPLQGAPGLVFYYTFDLEEVVLVGLEVEEWAGD